MGVYLIALVAIIYCCIAIDNFINHDYSHGFMWLCYSGANVALIFYELQKANNA